MRCSPRIIGHGEPDAPQAQVVPVLRHVQAQTVLRYKREYPDVIHLDIMTLGGFKRVCHRISMEHKGQFKNRVPVGNMLITVSMTHSARVPPNRPRPKGKQYQCLPRIRIRSQQHPCGTCIHVMPDNGPSHKGFALYHSYKYLSLRLNRTRLFSPRANRKAERFIHTIFMKDNWATSYGCAASS